ncbi:MAG: gliding motility-associated C-terminal domain-containing protein [Gemmatimonadetes bacterium]|nr:gliding motility-associated C-terminal domain-containing protein [Gemmatimonadota bacterium]
MVALPRIVTEDSIRVGFTTRVLHNATVFPLDLGLSERPGLWQSVEPAERRSQVVMLPELAEHGQLIDALELASPVITPNGDGINDALDMRFVVFKLDAATPTLVLYDLAGRQIAAVESTPTATGHRFTWTARDEAGAVVAPGMYLYRLDLGAESGPGTHTGAISVVY